MRGDRFTLSSGSIILLTVTLKVRMILQNIWRRVVGYVLIAISLTNIFLTLLLPAIFHQNCKLHGYWLCSRRWLGERRLFHIVVWIYNTFDRNFEIKNDFTKYMMESCRFCSNYHFSIKYFLNFAFACNISSKLCKFHVYWLCLRKVIRWEEIVSHQAIRSEQTRKLSSRN